MTTNLQQADGTLERVGGRNLIRFERRLSHPVERVWRAITEPEEIVQWLGEARLEPVAGGTFFLRWLNTPARTEARGTVTFFDPPRALELDTDTHGILRWELQPEGEDCVLIFTASYPEKDPATRLSLLSGWHIHLEHLEDALEGHPQDWPRWMDEQRPRWQEHHDRYAARVAMETAEIAAEAGMLIRRPVTDVFEAVVDPSVTTKFWITGSTGKLEEGERVRLDWAMYDVSAEVDVVELTEPERIVMRWPADDGGGQTTVEWRFTPHSDGTYVEVTNTGFDGDETAVAKQAVGATGGFTLVLAAMKAWLEHGIDLGLIRDRFPEGVEHSS